MTVRVNIPIQITSLLLLRFAVSVVFAGPKEDAPPVVQTKNGPVQGFRIVLQPPSGLVDQEALKADIFLGIPFARAPVGELRLKRPQPVGNWTDTLDASSIPPSCVPQHVLAAPDFSEDCLYLNIFRPSSPVPADTNTTAGFPVLVFIHGGGFCVGGTFVEGFANISSNLVSQGILAVTIQYRLNFLGFFSDGTAHNPGNLGLWDQRQALLWLRENIAYFGGDPMRVTVWGQSAGAASISLLSISPYSRDLFQQAIQQSGSFLSPWALNDRVVDTSLQTVTHLGCPASQLKEQLECLQALDIDDLVDGIQQREMVRSDFAMVVYNPRPDGDFVPKDISRALAEAPRKRTLMGFNSHESMFLTIHYPVSVFAFDSPLTVADVRKYNRTQLENFIRGCIRIAGGKEEQKLAKEIADRLVDFYVDNRPENDWEHLLEQYTLLLSDIQFINPIISEARLKAVNNWPIYLYWFDHVNEAHSKKLPFRGIVHAAEYPYTLGTELFGNYALDADDRHVQLLLLRAYGNFVKLGDPSPQLVNWPYLRPDQNSPLSIAHFGPGPSVHLETNPEDLNRRIQFWRFLSQQKGFSRVQGFQQMVL